MHNCMECAIREDRCFETNERPAPTLPSWRRSSAGNCPAAAGHPGSHLEALAVRDHLVLDHSDVCHGPHHPADLTEREAATPWAAGHPDTHHRQRAIPQRSRERSQLAPIPSGQAVGSVRAGPWEQIVMRFILALGLLIVLATATDARTVQHRTHHHVFIPRGAASSPGPSPGWGYDPYNDPSKFGGG